MSERVSFELPSDAISGVNDAVEAGDYESPSAVVSEALALWQRMREARAIEELRRLVAEADKSGFEPWEGAEVLKRRFREKYASQIKL